MRARVRRPSGRIGFRTRRPARALLLAGVAAVLAAPPAQRPAHADDSPILYIRARSRLQLTETERVAAKDGIRLTLRMQLTDQARATEDPPPLGGQPVRVRVQQVGGPDVHTETIHTDESGQATLQLPGLAPGSYRVLASYGGDDLRDAAGEQLAVDLGREPAQLGLEAPPSLNQTQALRVRVSLTSRGAALAGPVYLRLGRGPERAVELRLGIATVEVPLREIPGAKKGEPLTLTARFPGDRLVAAAIATRELWVTSQARVTLELPPLPAAGEIPQGNPLSVTGSAADEDGPLAGEPVDLEAAVHDPPPVAVPGEPEPPAPEPSGARRSLGSAVTDAQGRFRIDLKRLALRTGPAYLSAQVWPRRRFILAGRSPEVPIQVLPPEPVSPLFYLVPLGATALGMLFAVLARLAGPRLAALLRRLRARRTDDDAAAPETPAPPAAAWEASESGVRLSSKNRLPALTLRRTVDATVDGNVLDATFGGAIAAAQVVAEPLDEAASPAPAADGRRPASRLGTSSADGRFALIQMPPGRYRVRVTAPGYLPEEFSATIPHRGELRGVRVLLAPIRVRILGEWRRVAVRLLGTESQVQTRTPRELLADFDRLQAALWAPAHASQTIQPVQPPGAAQPLSAAQIEEKLRALTRMVEEAYYSPRAPTMARLDEAKTLADALLRMPVPTPPPPSANSGRSLTGERALRAPGAPRPRA